MKDKELSNLARFVKKTSSFKTKNPPKKPEHQPSKKELAEKYKLNLKASKLANVNPLFGAISI